VSEVRLLLADDHALLRHGLRRILEDRRGWQVVGEASNGRDAVAAAATLSPHVVICDVGMPLLNGIEATRQILRRQPQVRVLVLSMHSDPAYVAQALDAGARGYLLKESAGADLIHAVEALMAGRQFFSPSVADALSDLDTRDLARRGVVDRYEMLSQREREVLQLVAEGRSTKEIAELLAISAATVDTHRTRILQKLDLKNTAGVVLFAARRGIIS
jgi:DNA-binding NarL/FixJ family response regulator